MFIKEVIATKNEMHVPTEQQESLVHLLSKEVPQAYLMRIDAPQAYVMSERMQQFALVG